MKKIKSNLLFALLGTIYAGGGIFAQTVGDWPDATGGASGNKTYSVTHALGIGTNTPMAWTEIKYCPHLSPAIGLAISSHDVCASGGLGTGTGIGVNGDVILDPNATSPAFQMQGTISFVPISFPPNTGYHTFASGNAPLFVARTQSPGTPLGNSGLMGTESPRFLVNPDGKTGINSANPRAYLDVIGGYNVNEPIAMFGVRIKKRGTVALGPVQIDDYYTRHIALYPKVTTGFGNALTQSNDQVLLFTDGMLSSGLNQSGGLVIAPHSDVVGTGGIRIDATGNLIIKGFTEITGDILMHGKTEMRGELMCNGLKSKPKWWPDYVFSEDYKLISLDSISNFIAIHKHLPGMPSEAQVITDGQDIPLIQQLQQKKIEELTLYILELNTKLVKQQELLESLIIKNQEYKK